MILTDQNGNKYELNDLCNLDHILGYFGNRYFSAANAKIWKSKVTHFCRINGYFRERIKDASGSGFCYKIAQIKPDGSIMQIHNQLTAADSLKTFREILRYAAHPNQ